MLSQDGPGMGTWRRLNRLSNEHGRFAMLAIDQRGSLRRMIARQKQCSAESITEDELRLVKRCVTETIAPLATGILTDPLYGYPATATQISPSTGVLLALEVTGYDLAARSERRTRLLPDWNPEAALRAGADGGKLLIWHHPDASAETHAHQQEVVHSVGEACFAAGLPFVLEVVTYPLEGQEASTESFARLKPELVLDGARTYSDRRYKVDLLKLEFPASLGYTEEYQTEVFGRGRAVYGRTEVEDACKAIDEASDAPWVVLSAGVEIDEFVENIRLANAAGASGYLCGRAVWQHVIDRFPDEKSMRAFMLEAGRRNFRMMLEANASARPWYLHRRFIDPAAGEAAVPVSEPALRGKL